MKYTVGIATWYNGQWHLDPSTETAPMGELEAIREGHELAALGAFALYFEVETDRPMIEYQGRLEPAFAEMVAARR